MLRVLALMLGLAATAGLFYIFGFMAIIACTALALATLLFSSEPEGEEAVRHGRREAGQTGFESTTVIGAGW